MKIIKTDNVFRTDAWNVVIAQLVYIPHLHCSLYRLKWKTGINIEENNESSGLNFYVLALDKHDEEQKIEKGLPEAEGDIMTDRRNGGWPCCISFTSLKVVDRG